ncbi:hypothetical protein ACROYT_G012404 [Oculina patagonica]
MTHLNLSENRIGDSGAGSLSEALTVNTTLAHLNLGVNEIGGSGAGFLSEALRVNTTLTNLNLAANNIVDYGARSLSDALTVNTTLAELNLNDNKIGVFGAGALSKALILNTTLTHLDLSENRIGDSGAGFLSETLTVNTTLTHFNLSKNKIGDSGAGSLSKALTVNTALTHLDLTGNGIGVSGAGSLSKALTVNTALTHLDLTGNGIGVSGAGGLYLRPLQSGNWIGDSGHAFLSKVQTVNNTCSVSYCSLDVRECRCSEEDKRAALSLNIKIVEATSWPGYEELEWLSFPPDDLQIDVIVGHGVKLGHQAQVIRKSHKCRWVQVVHTDPEELGMFKSYENPISKGENKHKTEVELCEKADFVVGVGPKLSEAFRSYLRWCKKDQTVLDFTPGVFNDFVNVEHAAEERKRCGVLVFGRGDAEDFQLKGFDIAGKAIAQLKDAHLVFVGAPEGKHEDIAKRLLECGIPASRLTVRSFLQSREDLKRLFCEVDLVLMPSRTEGFGLTGLEALSAGLPVLVSKNSGFGEALHVVPFGSSCVIDSEDAKVWAEAINGIWKEDRETRLQEAEVLRSSYEKKYSWAKQSQSLVTKMISITNGMDYSDNLLHYIARAHLTQKAECQPHLPPRVLRE